MIDTLQNSRSKKSAVGLKWNFAIGKLVKLICELVYYLAAALEIIYTNAIFAAVYTK